MTSHRSLLISLFLLTDPEPKSSSSSLSAFISFNSQHTSSSLTQIKSPHSHDKLSHAPILSFTQSSPQLVNNRQLHTTNITIHPTHSSIKSKSKFKTFSPHHRSPTHSLRPLAQNQTNHHHPISRNSKKHPHSTANKTKKRESASMQWGPEADAKVRFVLYTFFTPIHHSFIPSPNLLNFLRGSEDFFAPVLWAG